MTAESAVVLPVLVAFSMALVWGLLVMAAQIQCVDAARAGARAAARQDPEGAVVAMARELAPSGARVTVSREGDQVRVVVVAEPPVLRGLPFEVREEAVAVAEAVQMGPDVKVGSDVEVEPDAPAGPDHTEAEPDVQAGPDDAEAGTEVPVVEGVEAGPGGEVGP